MTLHHRLDQVRRVRMRTPGENQSSPQAFSISHEENWRGHELPQSHDARVRCIISEFTVNFIGDEHQVAFPPRRDSAKVLFAHDGPVGAVGEIELQQLFVARCDPGFRAWPRVRRNPLAGLVSFPSTGTLYCVATGSWTGTNRSTVRGNDFIARFGTARKARSSASLHPRSP